MNDSDSNSGSWNSSKRRYWCNGGFRQSLSASLRSVFKQFETVTGTWTGSITGGSNITSQDYFALFAEKEIFNYQSYSTTTEVNALSAITYYQTASNRAKNWNGSAYSWWERSPAYNDGNSFCAVFSGGGADYYYASYAYGLAPFGCL